MVGKERRRRSREIGEIGRGVGRVEAHQDGEAEVRWEVGGRGGKQRSEDGGVRTRRKKGWRKRQVEGRSG